MADPVAHGPSLGYMNRLADFIVSSPTSYHTVATLAQSLRQAGFREFHESLPWEDVTGRCFFVRDGALVAWLTPRRINERTGLRVVGSHTDSPTLKLKPNADYTSAGWQMLDMELYGGPLLNSWLDRDLGLAGRVVTSAGQQLLVSTGPIMRVAQLASHLDRGANEALTLDRQAHMMPLWGVGGPDLSIETVLGGLAGVPDGQTVAGCDVLAYPTAGPQVFGIRQEFFASSRLDNLVGVFVSLSALLEQGELDDIAVLAAFDHEEVGSTTRSGASGPLLEDAVVRIADGLGYAGDAYRALLARSSCVSVDAAHAVHPNYPHLHDPNNKPLVNAGPVLKMNANQRYASDAQGSAVWRRACAAADVPLQTFVGNNAVPCGSTIGPLTAARLGLTTVDVGIPMLSMHSARELCGTRDPLWLAQALGAYWAGA